MNKHAPLAAAALVIFGTAAFLSPLRDSTPPLDRDAPETKAWRGWLAGRRAGQLERLRDYTRRGSFPKNRDVAGERVPYFIDAEGVPCAVANLILESGEGELARRVAAQDNHVRVAELKDGPVVDWILASGLLQEEAARIQPSYQFMNHRDPDLLAGDKERARIRTHLREVESELLEGTEVGLDFAVGRLLERVAKDPAFGRGLPGSPSSEARLRHPQG